MTGTERQYMCTRCRDTYWVCEDHDDRPWSGESACGCGGAGMPCPFCNVPDPGNRPRMPAGFVPDIDVDDHFPGLPKPKR
jgi:hypothetical protein